MALPELGVERTKAKIDTGAKTSAIHAWDLRADGDVVHFALHPVQRNDDVVVEASAPLVDEREVRSSNGETERRLVVSTPVVLGTHRADIELTLTSRDQMGFRMLLGREALRALDALVDPARSYATGRRAAAL